MPIQPRSVDQRPDTPLPCSRRPHTHQLDRAGSTARTAQTRRGRFPPMRWWMATGAVALLWAIFFACALMQGAGRGTPDSTAGWIAMAVLHMPYLLILALFAFGFVERIGFLWRGRTPPAPGRLPARLPAVCVQLPMFNEQAVAGRLIEAAAALDWPADRLVIQVLDDSTDAPTREKVRDICERVQARSGVRIHWVHRTDRVGYKAGALEAGRRQTDAEYLAIFDADFVPPSNFLRHAMPHFYDADARPDLALAIVQAQWGHLNDDESFLTEAQALWVDDHHSLQQSWRSANLEFVNFTGTAGIWRASAIEAIGGWRSASLVEDCELSFRALFAGYRARFLRNLAAPAELPQTFDAYRLQQKRWTQGWAQLMRMHLSTLLFRHHASLLRKIYLVYWMCISWQWPLWALWVVIFPFLIAHGLTLGMFGTGMALLIYLGPPLAFAIFSSVMATLHTRHGQGSTRGHAMRRCARIIPYLIVNTGMMAHHVCAFVEGLFGPLHAEFERTPKTASVTVAAAGLSPSPTVSSTPGKNRGKTLRKPYVVAEAAFLLAQLAWIALFLVEGFVLAAMGATWLAACIGIIFAAPLIHAACERRRSLSEVRS